MLIPLATSLAFAIQPVATPKSGDPSPAPAAVSGEGGYLEVPLKGEFGKEITAPGIRDAMRAARSRKASVVVLVFDTPGGRVADAQAIAATIDKERVGERGAPDLRVYAVINRAISASVWPLAHSDRIFFAPGAAAGAAVAFHWDVDSGNAEVDAKFNAAVAAEVAGAAEAHGQAGCIYRAMMIQDARLYGWPTPAGYKLSDTKPADTVKEVEEIDTPATVLAWTTSQACQYGWGTMMPSKDIAVLGPILKLDGWRSIGDSGVSAMARAAKDIERRTAETERAKDTVKKARQAVVDIADRIVSTGKIAVAAAPETVLKIHYTGTGQFTPQSQVEWRAQTDKAIQSWNSVVAMLGDLERAERRAAQTVDEFNGVRSREYQARLYTDRVEPIKLGPVEHGVDAKLVRQYAADAISKLSGNRMKTHL